MAVPLDPIVSARVPQEILDELDEVATELGVARSEVLKKTIAAALMQFQQAKKEETNGV